MVGIRVDAVAAQVVVVEEDAKGRRDGLEIGTNRIIPSEASPESSPSRRATMLALSWELDSAERK